MLLTDLYNGSNINNDKITDAVQSDYDGQNDKLKYTDSRIREMLSWLKTTTNDLSSRTDMLKENSDISTFSDMQRCAYNIIKAHSQHVSPKDPLLAIIIGVAGAGKSYLINAIRNLLCDSCAVTATTGKAAYNIHGCTIHSLLQLPVGSKRNKDLNGTNLIRLQTKLKHIRYIIIDEYSMLSQTLLGWIGKRCRQATGLTDERFGGKSIILVGDPTQLPPVADKPLYHAKPTNSKAI